MKRYVKLEVGIQARIDVTISLTEEEFANLSRDEDGSLAGESAIMLANQAVEKLSGFPNIESNPSDPIIWDEDGKVIFIM